MFVCYWLTGLHLKLRQVSELTRISWQDYSSPNVVWQAPQSAHIVSVLEQHDIFLENRTTTVNQSNSSFWLSSV